MLKSEEILSSGRGLLKKFSRFKDFGNLVVESTDTSASTFKVIVGVKI